MMIVEAYYPVKFFLTMGDSAAMTWPHHIEEDMSKINERMIGHGRGLQEELRERTKELLEEGEHRHIFCVK